MLEVKNMITTEENAGIFSSWRDFLKHVEDLLGAEASPIVTEFMAHALLQAEYAFTVDGKYVLRKVNESDWLVLLAGIYG